MEKLKSNEIYIRLNVLMYNNLEKGKIVSKSQLKDLLCD